MQVSCISLGACTRVWIRSFGKKPRQISERKEESKEEQSEEQIKELDGTEGDGESGEEREGG